METINISQYKPKMKLLKEIEELNSLLTQNTVIQAKVDGEFNYIYYERGGETFALNRWGTIRRELPCLTELKNALSEITGRAELLVELYAKEGDKPLKLPQFIHYIKSGKPELLNKIHIGVWDILSLSSTPVKENFLWKYDEASAWFKNCKLVNVLPYIQPANINQAETFYNTLIKQGYEGIVIRNNSETYKLKPKGEIDALVVAINKQSSYGKTLKKLTELKEVTSLHLALMNEQGDLIEIGDVASGIDRQLRKALYQLINFKVAEDEKRIWIKPFLIAQIEYTDLFPSTNKIYTKNYEPKGETQLIRMRHPRLIRFRADKKPTPTDIGTQQIPQRYLIGEV